VRLTEKQVRGALEHGQSARGQADSTHGEETGE